MAATFLDQGTAARWIPADATIDITPEDLEAITLAEWNAGTDIAGQLVVGSSTFQFTDPDTTDEKTWKDKGKVTEPTYDNYECSATMRRERTTLGILAGDDPLKVFSHRQIGYIVIRPGQPEDVEAAVGQDYTFYKVMVSKRNPIPDPNGETEKIEIGFLPRGHGGHGTFAAA